MWHIQGPTVHMTWLYPGALCEETLETQIQERTQTCNPSRIAAYSAACFAAFMASWCRCPMVYTCRCACMRVPKQLLVVLQLLLLTHVAYARVHAEWLPQLAAHPRTILHTARAPRAPSVTSRAAAAAARAPRRSQPAATCITRQDPWKACWLRQC